MVYHLKIQLKNVSKPNVWRRILVPAETPFDLLHDMIQIAYGWSQKHAYAFSPSGFGSSPWIVDEPVPPGYPDSPFRPKRKELTAYQTRLCDMINTEGQTFTYIYDFGDAWVNEITLEKINKLNIAPSAVLLGGKGASPPEDCGGPEGYKHFKEVLSNRNHPEFNELKKWLYETEYGINDELPGEMLLFEEDDDYELEVWNPKIYELEFTKEYFDEYFINIYEL